MSSRDWFQAHKGGLKQIAERLVSRRGFGIIAGELYQNVMDTSATFCKINIKREGRYAYLTVEDDGEGFKDLSHAWTLFAPSFKKDDPTKAGRFNFGEKMVLAFCKSASVKTTSGTVTFDEEGRHESRRSKTTNGTIFEAVIECNAERLEQFELFVERIIVRPGLTLTLNGKEVPHRNPIHTFNIALKTEIGDDLRPSIRKTNVEIYEPWGGLVGGICELGIPVVDTGDAYIVSIQQKIPLNQDRDNVTPSFLQSVRVAVFNEMHGELDTNDMDWEWVHAATDDPACSDEAITDYITKKYGEKRTSHDVKDDEANKRAFASGYTVIPGRSLTSTQWENVRRAGAVAPSGKLFATPKPFSDDPNAPLAEYIPESEWTKGMKHVAAYCKWLGNELLTRQISVSIVKRMGDCCLASYSKSRGELTFSLGALGVRWFDQIKQVQEELILHEMGHDWASDHLSEQYYDGLTTLAVRFKNLALNKPDELKKWYNG